VLKVAAAYAAIGWVALQGLSLLFQSFDAPGWVIKVVTTLVILGFPVACLMSWGFDITPEGVRPIPPAPKEPGPLPTAGSPAASVVEASASPSIAVLPFVDMSAEHDQQYLGDGIAEELLNALASIEGLNVAARTSSFSFHGKSVTMSEIGDTLHVRHVLEGSVRRAGQKLRVTAQLIDVKSGFHLFTQAYDRSVEDIFEIQNDIAREIAGALLPRLGLARDVALVRPGTRNVEAYDLWLKAHAWLTSLDLTRSEEVIEQLRQATALDRDFAEAWGDLCYLYGYMTLGAGDDPVPLLMEANRACALALDRSPRVVPALLYEAFLAQLLRRDSRASAAWYERARAAGADLSVWAFNRAYLLDGPMGRFDDAIAILREAEQQDPLAPNLKWALMEMYCAAGRVDEAVAVADAWRNHRSGSSDEFQVTIWTFVAGGRIHEALALLEEFRARSDEDDNWRQQCEFFCAGATGDHREARRLLERLLRRHAEGRPVSGCTVAAGYRALGDCDQALDWWARAVTFRETWTVTQMAVRYRSDPLIGKDPRFLALLKRMGLEGDGETKAAGQ
jgi:TolB-like protein